MDPNTGSQFDDMFEALQNSRAIETNEESFSGQDDIILTNNQQQDESDSNQYRCIAPYGSNSEHGDSIVQLLAATATSEDLSSAQTLISPLGRHQQQGNEYYDASNEGAVERVFDPLNAFMTLTDLLQQDMDLYTQMNQMTHLSSYSFIEPSLFDTSNFTQPPQVGPYNDSVADNDSNTFTSPGHVPYQPGRSDQIGQVLPGGVPPFNSMVQDNWQMHFDASLLGSSFHTQNQSQVDASRLSDLSYEDPYDQSLLHETNNNPQQLPEFSDQDLQSHLYLRPGTQPSNVIQTSQSFSYDPFLSNIDLDPASSTYPFIQDTQPISPWFPWVAPGNSNFNYHIDPLSPLPRGRMAPKKVAPTSSPSHADVPDVYEPPQTRISRDTRLPTPDAVVPPRPDQFDLVEAGFNLRMRNQHDREAREAGEPRFTPCQMGPTPSRPSDTPASDPAGSQAQGVDVALLSAVLQADPATGSDSQSGLGFHERVHLGLAQPQNPARYNAFLRELQRMRDEDEQKAKKLAEEKRKEEEENKEEEEKSAKAKSKKRRASAMGDDEDGEEDNIDQRPAKLQRTETTTSQGGPRCRSVSPNLDALMQGVQARSHPRRRRTDTTAQDQAAAADELDAALGQAYVQRGSILPHRRVSPSALDAALALADDEDETEDESGAPGPSRRSRGPSPQSPVDDSSLLFFGLAAYTAAALHTGGSLAAPAPAVIDLTAGSTISPSPAPATAAAAAAAPTTTSNTTTIPASSFSSSTRQTRQQVRESLLRTWPRHIMLPSFLMKDNDDIRERERWEKERKRVRKAAGLKRIKVNWRKLAHFRDHEDYPVAQREFLGALRDARVWDPSSPEPESGSESGSGDATGKGKGKDKDKGKGRGKGKGKGKTPAKKGADGKGKDKGKGSSSKK